MIKKEEKIVSDNQESRQIIGNYAREFSLTSIDTDNRTVELSFSSEVPYARWFGNEILCHDESCINLERFNNGLGTLLFNHDRDAVIGHIDKVWIEDLRGKAIVRFDTDEESDKIFQKVQAGTLQGISVGYAINRYEELIDSDTKSSNGRFTGPAYIVTDWEPLEISVVSVPADPTVGIGRSVESDYKKETKMNTKEKNITQTNTVVEDAVHNEPDNTTNVVEEKGMTSEEFARAMQDERNRVSNITALCRDFGVEGAEQFINEGKSVEAVREHVIAQLRQRNTAVNIQMGETETEKFRAAAQDAVLLAAGIRVDNPSAGAQELRARSMVELARETLMREGHSMHFTDNLELVREAINSTSTFPVLLSNLANKSLVQGYETAPTTFQTWTGKGTNRDFKKATRVMLSDTGDLVLVPEGGQYKDSKIYETSATVKLDTYGRKFSLTRQAIINDDLNGFATIAAKMGNSAKVLINRMVYNALTGNTVLEDGIALFDVKHGNIAVTGAPLSVESLGKAVAAMRRQKQSGANRNLNIQPKYLIVPPELEVKAYQVTKSVVDPALNNDAVNPFMNRFEIVVDAEITDPEAWYLAGDPNQVQTIEVSYLNGVETPRLETKNGFNVDGIEYKVGMDCATTVLDFRGLYKNEGK